MAMMAITTRSSIRVNALQPEQDNRFRCKRKSGWITDGSFTQTGSAVNADLASDADAGASSRRRSWFDPGAESDRSRLDGIASSCQDIGHEQIFPCPRCRPVRFRPGLGQRLRFVFIQENPTL